MRSSWRGFSSKHRAVSPGVRRAGHDVSKTQLKKVDAKVLYSLFAIILDMSPIIYLWCMDFFNKNLTPFIFLAVDVALH